MIGNCGQLVQPLGRFLVQRFDVFENVAECNIRERIFLVAKP